jgi:hypothetical protein
MPEYDLIQIISIILALLLGSIAVLSFRNSNFMIATVLVVVVIIPLLWSGILRLPVPQTMIWIGMNVSAMVFCWQGFMGLVSGHANSSVLPLPDELGNRGRHIASLFLGSLFILLIVLTQI